MINLFGTEDEDKFYPLTRFGKVIPYYYVMRDGKIYNNKSNKWVKTAIQFADGDRGTRCGFSVRLPREDWFLQESGYIYSSKSVAMTVHRAVKESIEPIDDHPPDCLKDTWNLVPDEWRQWVRDTALIDHIDNDPLNNHVSNLRWTTPLENERHRKRMKSTPPK